MKKNKSELSITRIILQAGFLLITFLIGLRHLLPGESSKGGAFDAFCPFGGIETLWKFSATGNTLEFTNLLNFSVLLAVIAVSVFAGRAFCGWMCPLGTLQDYLAALPKLFSKNKSSKSQNDSRITLPMEAPAKFDKWGRYFKYIFLILILVASTKAVSPPLHNICPARAIFGFQINTPLLALVVATFILSSVI
ncbi:MAG: 4Fe-4S binding protein, partial [Candidatus Heimdallarchaeota archaeon]|nr:4Fe-4S binding protein [Candidatus Heimdallarchaeota archaeon]